MRNNERVACLFGDYNMIRPLGLAGIPVVGTEPKRLEQRWSRHTIGALDVFDLWRESEAAIVGELNRFARTQDHRPVLYYQTDSAATLVSRQRHELAECFDFVIPAPELVEDLLDKSRFAALSARAGLRTPCTFILECGKDGVIDDCPFPAVAKPAVRNRGADWSTVAEGGKAIRCNSRAELEQVLSAPRLDGMRLVVQEEIPGPEQNIWSYHAFIDDDRRTRAEFTGQKIRTWPKEFGTSTSVRVVAQDEVREVGREVLGKIDFTGVAKIDFKRDSDDELVVLEINPRFSLWHSPGARAGVNIPAIVHQYLGGSDVVSPPAVSEARWCHPKEDWVAARAEGIPFPDWLRFVRSCSSRHAVQFDDPLSMAGVVGYGVNSVVDRVRRGG